MKIEHVTIPDDLAAETDRLWPDSTWSEVIEYALAVVVSLAISAGEDSHDETPEPMTANSDFDWSVYR